MQQKLLHSVLAFLFGLLGVTPTVAPITPTPTAQQITQKEISVSGVTYAYSLIGPVNGKLVRLISNLPEKKITTEIKKEQACQFLTSGGFYSENDRHIGLFLVNDIVKNEQHANPTFNGYVFATNAGVSGIGVVLPDEPLLFALQTGPLLIDHKERRKLKLTSDGEARRIVAGVTEDTQLVFLSVYNQTNTYLGPYLVELPHIIEEISKKEHLRITDAINLDGGNHSAFYGNDVTLQELSPVGSMFCIK